MKRTSFTALIMLILGISVFASGNYYPKPLPNSSLDLSRIKYKLIYESYSNKNWDLHIINADGTGKKNITNTPGLNEMYPKVSPNGKKVAFVVDTGEGRTRKRDLYIMDIDGDDRQLISKDSRQPAWSPDGRYIAFVKAASSRRFSKESWATKGLYFYDTRTGNITEHPNKKLEHLYNLYWSPDGQYITATVLGGMGFRHTNIAINKENMEFFQMGIIGCRPEFDPSGTKVAWGRSDIEFKIADIDLKKRPPVSNKTKERFVRILKGHEIYHIDWSPDGKYAAFSYGPDADQEVGGMAPGWNICIAEISTGKWTMITTDGNHNKEPDWIP